MTNSSTHTGIAGETVAFSLDNALVGTAVTNSSGVATLNNITTADAAGTDTGGIIARFAGDSSNAASNGTGNLVVSQAGTSFHECLRVGGFRRMATLTATLISSVTGPGDSERERHLQA